MASLRLRRRFTFTSYPPPFVRTVHSVSTNDRNRASNRLFCLRPALPEGHACESLPPSSAAPFSSLTVLADFNERSENERSESKSHLRGVTSSWRSSICPVCPSALSPVSSRNSLTSASAAPRILESTDSTTGKGTAGSLPLPVGEEEEEEEEEGQLPSPPPPWSQVAMSSAADVE